jgi:hypothetical protein
LDAFVVTERLRKANYGYQIVANRFELVGEKIVNEK